MFRRICFVLLALLVIIVTRTVPTRCEVTSATPSSFSVESSVVVNRAPGEVFGAIVDDVSSWWDPAHTFSGNAGNLSIDARANGCFCEKLDSGGSVRHLTVVHVDPGKMLRLTGGLGPLQQFAVVGTLTFSLQSEGQSTMVTLTYLVAGVVENGFEHWAPAVDGVLAGQLVRLKTFLETGSPREE